LTIRGSKKHNQPQEAR